MLQRFTIKMKIVHRYGKYWMEMRFRPAKRSGKIEESNRVSGRKEMQSKRRQRHTETAGEGGGNRRMHAWKKKRIKRCWDGSASYRVTLAQSLCLYIAVGLTDCLYWYAVGVCVCFRSGCCFFPRNSIRYTLYAVFAAYIYIMIIDFYDAFDISTIHSNIQHTHNNNNLLYPTLIYCFALEKG